MNVCLLPDMSAISDFSFLRPSCAPFTFLYYIKVMAKDKIAYVCSNCGQESTKWIGKCPSCGQWNTFKEIRISSDAGQMAATSAAATVRRTLRNGESRAVSLSEITAVDEPRMDMHDAELNRVLGGGLVPGSIVLLGGEPGIGKSTLTLQTILRMPERKILYVSGEESAISEDACRPH